MTSRRKTTTTLIQILFLHTDSFSAGVIKTVRIIVFLECKKLMKVERGRKKEDFGGDFQNCFSKVYSLFISSALVKP